MGGSRSRRRMPSLWVPRGERRQQGADPPHTGTPAHVAARVSAIEWRMQRRRENMVEYGAVEAGSFFSQGIWELLEADTMLLAPFFLRAECYSASAGDSLRVIGDSHKPRPPGRVT
jgi:hypothetical protein